MNNVINNHKVAADARRTFATLVLLLVVLIAVAGCATSQDPSAPGVAGVLGRLKPLATQCTSPVDGYVALDISSSAKGDDDLIKSRVSVLQAVADRVAACGGTFKAVAFSSSVANGVELGAQTFPSDFGTENARLIRADKTEKKLFEAVNANLDRALSEPRRGGTDVVNQLALAQEFTQGSGADRAVVTLLTDGLDTAGSPQTLEDSFDKGAANALASATTPPKFTNTELSIVGVGRTAGADTKPLSAEHIAALKTFYAAVCDKTGADCTVTTSDTARSE